MYPPMPDFVGKIGLSIIFSLLFLSETWFWRLRARDGITVQAAGMWPAGSSWAQLLGCFPSAEPGRWTGENPSWGEGKKSSRPQTNELSTDRRLLTISPTCWTPTGSEQTETDCGRGQVHGRGMKHRPLSWCPFHSTNPSTNPQQEKDIKIPGRVLLGSKGAWRRLQVSPCGRSCPACGRAGQRLTTSRTPGCSWLLDSADPLREGRRQYLFGAWRRPFAPTPGPLGIRRAASARLTKQSHGCELF